MKLANLLDQDELILDLEAVDHWDAIVELVDRLVTAGKLHSSHRHTILDSLKIREDMVSTGIGSGVAIPHAFSDQLEEVIAVFGRSKQGIDFEALDNAPVHLIFLFIVPRRDYQLHLKTLAAIAKTFTNPRLRNALRDAPNHAEIRELLITGTVRPAENIGM
ncbi:MAG: PTS sugar transporter subunit IIA [Luteolibacter sp.]